MTNTIITTVDDTPLAPVVGLWDNTDVASKLFTRYRATIQFTNRVLGGVPQKPDIIESWLRQRIIGGDEELKQVMLRTLDELGHEVDDNMTADQLDQLTKKVAKEQNSNTFKREVDKNGRKGGGVYLSNYQIKAMLRENVAMLYPYSEKVNRMGPTSKAAKAFWNERVHVDEEKIFLGRDEPDGMHLQIGHVPSPKGQKSTLTYYAYCENTEENPLTATFTLSSMEDMIPPEMWQRVLLSAELNALGAVRSMSTGRFKVLSFDKV